MKGYVNEHHNYLVDKFWYSGFTGFIFSSERKYAFLWSIPVGLFLLSLLLPHQQEKLQHFLLRLLVHFPVMVIRNWDELILALLST